MKKEDKALIINQIVETLGQYSAFYPVETAGLDAEKTSALRRACFNADIKLLVVKNTLLHKALESMEGDYPSFLRCSQRQHVAHVHPTWATPRQAPEGLRQERRYLPVLKGAYVEERPYTSVPTSSTPLHLSRARTSSSPTLSPCCNRLPRMLSAPSGSGATTIHGVLETLSKKGE